MTDHIAIAGEQIAADEKSIDADQAAEVIDASDKVGDSRPDRYPRARLYWS